MKMRVAADPPPASVEWAQTAEVACFAGAHQVTHERLFAVPGTKAYGAVSVLVQLACERTGTRTVSRSVFVPQPNVDSMLVAFRRREGFAFDAGWAWTGTVVHGAFAHRRKTLANSLRLAGLPAPPAEIADLRAEQLPPERVARLAEELRG